jgi:hypothetical protein
MNEDKMIGKKFYASMNKETSAMDIELEERLYPNIEYGSTYELVVTRKIKSIEDLTPEKIVDITKEVQFNKDTLEIENKKGVKFEWEHERLVFDTEEDALAYFQDSEGVESDDVDKEEARFEEWFNGNNIKIKD